MDLIIRHLGPYDKYRGARYYRSTTYYIAVEGIGESIFWAIKKEQELI